MSNHDNISLREEDFCDKDVSVFKELESMYSVSTIENYTIIRIEEYCCLIEKKEIPHFAIKHLETLYEIISDNEFHNPIYVQIDPDGTLCID